MLLRELRIDRLPGIDRPFAIDGTPGLNLVLGPNGSGKSSLCRATLGLLWPDPATTGQIVSATWELDGAVWLAERAGGPAVVWQRDGSEAPAPRLAGAPQAGIYHLGVLDLLKPAADHTDSALAAEIRRQLAGGVDLAALRERFAWSKQAGKGTAKELQATRRRLRELTAKQQAVADDEGRLAELETQYAAALAAAERRDALERGRDLARAMADLQDALDALAAYPAVMQKLHGDEDTRLAGLVTAREKAANGVEEADRDYTDADRDRAAADLPDGGPDDVTIDAARQELAHARDLAAELRGASDELAAAEEAVTVARAQLGSIEPPASADPVSNEQVDAAVAGLRDRDRDRAVRDGLDSLLARDDLGREGTAAAEPASLASARKVLADWLANTTPPDAWPLRVLPWVASLALIGLGAALEPWQTQDWRGWAALGLGAMLLPAWLLLRRRTAAAQARRRRDARAAFAATGVGEPEHWERQSVGRQLRGLLAEEAAAVQDRLREQLREALQGERRAAAERLGDDDPVAELDQAQVLQRVAAWHAATAARAAAERRVANRSTDLEEHHERLAAHLAAWWTGDATDLVMVGSTVDDLARRRDRHRDATARLEAAARQRDAARDRAETAATDLATLLARLDLDEDGADRAIADLLARLQDHRAAAAAVDRATAERDRCQRVRDDLSDHQSTIAGEALAMPTARLDAAIGEAADQADRADRLLEDITAIKTRVQDARADSELTATHAREERLRRDLAAERDLARGNALAGLLLARAGERYEAATEPPLLQRTERLFTRFTGGGYQLQVNDGPDGPRFLARDGSTGRSLTLDQLSDGTRAQLLLAARLAALPEHERGPRPPLFLDESLTASDPVRFQAIGKALLDLVREEGRQVFYLTCDAADVAAWQGLLQDAGEEPATVIDLARERRLTAAASPDRLRPVPAVNIPAPATDQDAAAYGAAIDVPPLSVLEPATGAHLFYLLIDDLHLLHELLRRRISTRGEQLALADDLAAAGVLDSASLAHLDTRTRALTAFLDAFATGRGRPIPTGAIQHESGIRSSQLAEVEELAQELGGDAVHLMEALTDGRIKGMRQAKKDEVADWLTAAGYLDPRPMLDQETVRRHTIRALRADLSTGHIDWQALDRLIDTWWQAAGAERSDSLR